MLMAGLCGSTRAVGGGHVVETEVV